MVFFLALTFIPILLTGFFSFQISSKIIYKMAIESSREMIDRIGHELNSLFSDTIYFMDHVQKIKSLQYGLRGDARGLERPYQTDLDANEELRVIIDYKDELFGIYVIGEKRKYKSHYNFFSGDELNKTSWYEEIIKSDELKVYGPYKDSLVINTAYSWKMDFFAFGAPFRDNLTGEKNGIVLAEIEKQLIKNITDSTLGKTGYIILLDGNNNIVLAPDNYKESADFSSLPVIPSNNFFQLIINQSFSDRNEVEETVVIVGEEYIILYKVLNIPNWKVVGVIPYRELRTDKDNNIWLIIFISIISCLSAAFAAWRISIGIVKPVSNLSSLMKEVEKGNLMVEIDNPRLDEIGQLSNSFNIMVEKLRQSMDQIYESQGKIRKTELQLLQAQINPHFLYNTLDTIKYLAKKNENGKVVKMVVSLARFFRSSLSKGMAIISLQEELERIEHYLNILRLRYNERFDYEFSIPPALMSQRILKLLLQPIVENAVYHGIKEKPGPGKIRIEASTSGDDCYITVEDTGAGISAEKLHKLEKSIYNKSNPEGDNYGLWNVQERIEIFYGPGYGLSFKSSEGEGTKVIIKIPKDNKGGII